MAPSNLPSRIIVDSQFSDISPYYTLLFGRAEAVTVKRAILLLKKNITTDREHMLQLVALILVDGLLLPTSHIAKISKVHAEMAENLDKFMSYLWGRASFDMVIVFMRERDIAKLATGSYAVQGFIHALQYVVIYAVPSIQDEPASSSAPIILESSSDSEEESGSEDGVKQPRFRLVNARKIDKECQIMV